MAYLMDAGPTRINPLGEAPLDWADVLAYSNATGNAPEVWERRALRKMSQNYMQARTAGEHPLAIPPVEQETDG